MNDPQRCLWQKYCGTAIEHEILECESRWPSLKVKRKLILFLPLTKLRKRKWERGKLEADCQIRRFTTSNCSVKQFNCGPLLQDVDKFKLDFDGGEKEKKKVF